MNDPENQECYMDNVKPDEAGAASVAQSIANAVQDQVDLIRNQNIIKTTAMGNAYAKWLSNPLMKTEYQSIIQESSIADPKKPFNMANQVLKFYSQQFESE